MREKMAKKKSLVPGLSFSWKRALGVSSAKRKAAKATGLPTTIYVLSLQAYFVIYSALWLN